MAAFWFRDVIKLSNGSCARGLLVQLHGVSDLSAVAAGASIIKCHRQIKSTAGLPSNLLTGTCTQGKNLINLINLFRLKSNESSSDKKQSQSAR